MALLAIEGENNILVNRTQNNPNVRIVGQDNGAVGQGMRTDRGEHDYSDGWINDGTSCC